MQSKEDSGDVDYLVYVDEGEEATDDVDDEDRVDEDDEQSAEDLANELLETQLQTTDDGHVRALVTDISQASRLVEIT